MQKVPWYAGPQIPVPAHLFEPGKQVVDPLYGGPTNDAISLLT